MVTIIRSGSAPPYVFEMGDRQVGLLQQAVHEAVEAAKVGAAPAWRTLERRLLDAELPVEFFIVAADAADTRPEGTPVDSIARLERLVARITLASGD